MKITQGTWNNLRALLKIRIQKCSLGLISKDQVVDEIMNLIKPLVEIEEGK